MAWVGSGVLTQDIGAHRYGRRTDSEESESNFFRYLTREPTHPGFGFWLS